MRVRYHGCGIGFDVRSKLVVSLKAGLVQYSLRNQWLMLGKSWRTEREVSELRRGGSNLGRTITYSSQSYT
jgi:hypothetical protein